MALLQTLFGPSEQIPGTLHGKCGPQSRPTIAANAPLLLYYICSTADLR